MGSDSDSYRSLSLTPYEAFYFALFASIFQKSLIHVFPPSCDPSARHRK